MIKVLVIEDDPSLRLLWRVGLEAHGMQVIEAVDGVHGLELAQREHPDVITLDVVLPRLDGWGVARRLREDTATRDIPIVFLTARAEHCDRERGLELGAVEYVTVPINPTRLPQTIEAVLERVERGRLQTSPAQQSDSNVDERRADSAHERDLLREEER